jgi:hypothetical protein
MRAIVAGALLTVTVGEFRISTMSGVIPGPFEEYTPAEESTHRRRHYTYIVGDIRAWAHVTVR